MTVIVLNQWKDSKKEYSQKSKFLKSYLLIDFATFYYSVVRSKLKWIGPQIYVYDKYSTAIFGGGGRVIRGPGGLEHC